MTLSGGGLYGGPITVTNHTEKVWPPTDYEYGNKRNHLQWINVYKLLETEYNLEKCLKECKFYEAEYYFDE